MNNWISNFLCQRKQQVVVDGHSSNSVAVDSGIPQGMVLGPILFLPYIYINDLPEYVDCNVPLFADDCVIYNVINSPEGATVLQQDLSKLEQWQDTWKMDFNPSKCFYLTCH